MVNITWPPGKSENDTVPAYAAYMHDPTGFPNRTDSGYTFDNATRLFTTYPVATSFEYFESGYKYVTKGDSITTSDVEGIHVVYYDKNTLTEVVNPTAHQLPISTKSLVSLFYWDKSEGIQIYLRDERHGIQMPGATHSYIHYADGMAYLSGLLLNNMVVDASGALDAHAQFGVNLGSLADEDIHESCPAILSTTGLPIYHMLGVTEEWQRTIKPGFPMRTFDNTNATRMCFNDYNGGDWKLTEGTNNDCILCHVMGTGADDYPHMAMMGQASYSNKTLARAGASVEIYNLIVNNIVMPEVKPLYTVIYQTSDGYANEIKGRIIHPDTSNLLDYEDWRNVRIPR